jgi:predicted nucleic acid-binding protein
MIVVDTSIWIDHLRAGDDEMAALLNDDRVLVHPFVIGEIALGSLRNRAAVMRDLNVLDQPPMARHDEVIRLVEQHGLGGSGIGYVDAHLLASTKLHGSAKLWSRDKRLAEMAIRLKVSYFRLN